MAQITGSSGNDNRIGTTGDDTLDGLGGNDTLAGSAGNDSIRGGAGNDWLYGDDDPYASYSQVGGNDSLVGGAGDDLIDGGLGTDNAQFTGNRADYRLSYGEGGLMVTDTVAGRDGADTLNGIESLWFADGQVPVDRAICLTVSDITQYEGNSGSTLFTFTITLAYAPSLANAISLNWAVAASQVDAADFVGNSLPSGTTRFDTLYSPQLVTVMVNGDWNYEGNEAFSLVFSNPVIEVTLANTFLVGQTILLYNGFLVGSTSAAGTILNDDTGFIITPDSLRTEEGTGTNSVFGYTVTRLGSTSGAVSVDWAVNALDTNAADYALGIIPSGRLAFASGQTTSRIQFSVSGDSTVEADEAFRIVLSNGIADYGETSFPVAVSLNDRIVNDDLPRSTVSIAAGIGGIAEGNTGTRNDTFTVTRSGDLGVSTTVPWTVQSSGTGSERADASDFANAQLPSGSLFFAAGEAVKTIQIPIQGDLIAESDESYAVVLGTPSAVGAQVQLGTASATGRILNDDQKSFTVALQSGDRKEGNTGNIDFLYVVSRNGSTSEPASLNWRVSGGAVDAFDFPSGVIPSGRLDFLAGQTSATFTVRVAGDATPEPNESIDLVFSDAKIGTETVLVTRPATLGTVLDDDLAYQIRGQASTRFEGNTGKTALTFMVTRSGAALESAELPWAVIPITVNSADFAGGVLPTGRVTFAAGQSETQIQIDVAADVIAEPNEWFTVAVTVPNGNGVETLTAIGVIRDDDQPALTSIVGLPSETGSG